MAMIGIHYPLPYLQYSLPCRGGKFCSLDGQLKAIHLVTVRFLEIFIVSSIGILN